jgi:predicted phage terminase large subunit-like protein
MKKSLEETLSAEDIEAAIKFKSARDNPRSRSHSEETREKMSKSQQRRRRLSSDPALAGLTKYLENKDILLAEKMRRRLRTYVEYAWHIVEPSAVFQPNFHIDAICDHLEATARGEIRNIIINVPPRFLKSNLTSVFFPTWCWATWPNLKFVYASYSKELSQRDSIKCASIWASNWYQKRWGHVFKLERAIIDYISNDKGGLRHLTAVTAGKGTGYGGDFIIADDPNDMKKIFSDTVRNDTIMWWDYVMPSRLDDPKTGRRIVIQQRGHMEDLTGHILETSPESYEHLVIPLEFDPKKRCFTKIWKDPRTKKGELLHEERLGRIEAEQLQKNPFVYAGQYQQTPVPEGGAIIKKDWLRYYRYTDEAIKEYLTKASRVIQSWDTKLKAGGLSSSFVVGQVWAKVGGAQYILLDQKRGRLDFVGTLEAVRELTEKWPRAEQKYVEAKASGPAVINSLKDQIDGLIESEPGTDSKEGRVASVSYLFEAGNVYIPHPKDCPWIQPLIDEWTTFPASKYDDQCDAMSQALIKLKEYKLDPNAAPLGVGTAGYYNKDFSWVS